MKILQKKSIYIQAILFTLITGASQNTHAIKPSLESKFSKIQGSFSHSYTQSHNVNNAAIFHFKFNYSNVANHAPRSSPRPNFNFSLLNGARGHSAQLSKLSFILAKLHENYNFQASGVVNLKIFNTHGAPLVVSSAPEPEQWLMMMVGLFAVGAKISKARARNVSPLALNAQV